MGLHAYSGKKLSFRKKLVYLKFGFVEQDSYWLLYVLSSFPAPFFQLQDQRCDKLRADHQVTPPLLPTQISHGLPVSNSRVEIAVIKRKGVWQYSRKLHNPDHLDAHCSNDLYV